VAGRVGRRPLRGRCGECSAAITAGHLAVGRNRPALCLACLAERPDAPFSVRLKACRLAAGLTAEQLAARSGVPAYAIPAVERGACWPRWERVARLVRALRADLVTLGLVGQTSGKRGGRGRERTFVGRSYR
jgi:DNA-binding XRE family transcriptional regulator